MPPFSAAEFLCFSSVVLNCRKFLDASWDECVSNLDILISISCEFDFYHLKFNASCIGSKFDKTVVPQLKE